MKATDVPCGLVEAGADKIAVLETGVHLVEAEQDKSRRQEPKKSWREPKNGCGDH
jgi:hypothetical protein